MARPKKEQIEEVNEPIDETVEVNEVKEEQLKEQIEEVKKVEVFNEAKSVDDIYEMICELHKESEELQRKAAIELNLIPTQLQVVTTQLNICKNNIARALGK